MKEKYIRYLHKPPSLRMGRWGSRQLGCGRSRGCWGHSRHSPNTGHGPHSRCNIRSWGRVMRGPRVCKHGPGRLSPPPRNHSPNKHTRDFPKLSHTTLELGLHNQNKSGGNARDCFPLSRSDPADR